MANAGYNVLSGAGGFAQGFADALLRNRERSDQKARDKQAQLNLEFSRMFPIGWEIYQETGDTQILNDLIERTSPEWSKEAKKRGFDFNQIGSLLHPAGPTSATMSAPGAAPPTTGERAAHADYSRMIAAGDEATGRPTRLPSTPVASGLTTAAPTVEPPPPAPPRQTLFGVEMPTPEERATRAGTTAASSDLAGMQVRRRAYAQLVDQGIPDADAWALAGLPDRPEPAAARGLGGVEGIGTLGSAMPPGMRDVWGQPINPALRYRVQEQPDGSFKAVPTDATTGTEGATLGSFEDFVLRYAQDRGVTAPTAEMITQARRVWTEAGRAIQETDGDVGAMAEWTAAAPELLQGLTGTDIRPILGAIAERPELKLQYERARMEPMRGRAQTMLDAIDKLLVVDDATDAVLDLTDEAKALFGPMTPAGARPYLPWAADASAALQQIVGQQIVDLIADMKAQSRTGATGFGQLSVRELDVLEAAATQLTRRLSEPQALSELKKLREKMALVMLPGAVEQAATTAGAGTAAPGASATPGATGYTMDDQGNIYENGQLVIPVQ